MLCPRCKYQNKPDAKNCWKCGVNLQAAAHLVSEAERDKPIQENQENQENTEQTRICTHCGQVNPIDATRCSSCSYYFPLTDAQRVNNFSSTSKFYFSIFAVIVVAIGAFFIYDRNTYKPPRADPTPTADTPTETGAIWFCQDTIKNLLVSPSTAKFQDVFTAEVTQDGNTFTVSSFVDSQNAFGAMLRTHFICKLEYTGKRTWKLLDINY
jgi:ribosomal protein L40E